jgi:hypothetical protein
VADRVLVRRVVLATGEQPVREVPELLVVSQDRGQLVGHRHRSLGPVLRQPDLHVLLAGPLHLPPYVQLAAGVVDVAELQRGRLPEPQPRQRANRDERPEPLTATSRQRATSPGEGMVSASARRRWRGSLTLSVGSTPIKRSRTAARKTDRTFTKRVLILPGASAARDSVGVAIDFTQVSMCVVRILRSSVDRNDVPRTARAIAAWAFEVQT